MVLFFYFCTFMFLPLFIIHEYDIDIIYKGHTRSFAYLIITFVISGAKVIK